RRAKRVSDGKSPKRLPPTPEEKVRLDQIATRLKQVYETRKTLRQGIFGAAAVKASLSRIDDEANDKVKAARASFRAAGLAWGTGGAVEQAAAKFRTGAPPRFVRSSSWSQIASQIQGGVEPAYTAEDDDNLRPQCAWRCEIQDARVSIQRTDRRTSGAWHYECRLRVSSAEANQ